MPESPVIRRTYFGNSFNLSYGLTYFRFRLRLGSEVLSRASGGQLPPGVDILRVESLGPNFGIGNGDEFFGPQSYRYRGQADAVHAEADVPQVGTRVSILIRGIRELLEDFEGKHRTSDG